MSILSGINPEQPDNLIKCISLKALSNSLNFFKQNLLANTVQLTFRTFAT